MTIEPEPQTERPIEQERIECERRSCEETVPEDVAIQVAAGFYSGHGDDPEPHVRVAGIDGMMPPVKRWCPTCAEAYFEMGLDEMADARRRQLGFDTPLMSSEEVLQLSERDTGNGDSNQPSRVYEQSQTVRGVLIAATAALLTIGLIFGGITGAWWFVATVATLLSLIITTCAFGAGWSAHKIQVNR